MKKILLALVALVATTFILVGCKPKVLKDPVEKNRYFATGHFAGWGDNFKSFELEAIANNDPRVKSIASKVKDFDILYVREITLGGEGAAPWTIKWNVPYVEGSGKEKKTFADGTEYQVDEIDGRLAIKVILANPIEGTDDFSPIFWAQNKESGEVKNLTPDTFVIPTYVETNNGFGGTWGDNPFAKEAGTYYLVWGQKTSSGVVEKYMGLIPKK